jgi:hypothetical protein
LKEDENVDEEQLKGSVRKNGVPFLLEEGREKRRQKRE